MKPKIISWASEKYRNFSRKIKEDCYKYNYDIAVYYNEPRETLWQAKLLTKIKVLIEVCEDSFYLHRLSPIVWLDCDARILSNPVFFETLETGQFYAHRYYRKPQHNRIISTAILGFTPSKLMAEIFKKWYNVHEHQVYRFGKNAPDDEPSLTTVLREDYPELLDKLIPFPKEYYGHHSLNDMKYTIRFQKSVGCH